ncbi:DUF58 domain-containing protein [Vannielia litorea]|uniref:DUF58 domain-containing protein n=1 Tax=Vannielia litorea TaxID=1217970 RepID=UPI0021BD7A57|nr:DUF58 domain-containing protein [Vannielia litorea]
MGAMEPVLDIPGVALDAERLIALREMAVEREVAAPPAALPGGFLSKRRGSGQEIADTREYVAGDDIRHLDRGSTARTGVLHIRRFQEERDRVTFLVLDLRPSMLWGTGRAFRSVAAAEVLALIGWRAVEEGGRVGLMTLGAGGPEIVGARGRTRGMLSVIGGMVRAHDAALTTALEKASAEPDLAGLLRPLERIAPRGAELMLASGFDVPGDDLGERMGALAQKRHPFLLEVHDRGPGGLPEGQYPVRVKGGAVRMLRVTGAGPGEAAPRGFPSMVIEAAAPVPEAARRLHAIWGR